jgi:hypothetical protein
MIESFSTLVRLFKAIGGAWRTDPQFRTLVGLVFFTLLSGTIFYTLEEGWSIVDAFYLNVWCEMGSPSQQVSESEPRSSEALVEPDAEVVQRYPGRQSYPQPANVVGALSAKAEGVVQLLVDTLHNLTDGRSPASQPLWPTSAASIAFWRADDARSVEIEPPPMVFLAFEAFE